MTVAEFELAFTRCRNNSKTVGNLTVRNSLRDVDAIERYLHPKCRSVIVLFSNDAVSKMCRLEFSFSKSTVFKMCRQKGCRFRVNRRPISHIFHRFQNVSASCERSLRCKVLFGNIAHHLETEIRKILVRGWYRNENSMFDSGP